MVSKTKTVAAVLGVVAALALASVAATSAAAQWQAGYDSGLCSVMRCEDE